MTDLTVRTTTAATTPATPAAATAPAPPCCPHCGRGDAEPPQVVSRHHTSTGLTIWTRCHCGSLQVRVRTERGVRTIARSRPASGE